MRDVLLCGCMISSPSNRGDEKKGGGVQVVYSETVNVINECLILGGLFTCFFYIVVVILRSEGHVVLSGDKTLRARMRR